MRHNLALQDQSSLLVLVAWAVVIAVAIAVAGGAVTLRHEAATLRVSADQAQKRVEIVQHEAAQADARVVPFRQASEIAARLGAEAIAPTALRQVEPNVPADVWFTDVTMSRDTIGVDGRGLGLDSIAKTANAFRTIPGIASAEITVVTKSGEGWYTFHIVANPTPKTTLQVSPSPSPTPVPGTRGGPHR